MLVNFYNMLVCYENSFCVLWNKISSILYIYYIYAACIFKFATNRFVKLFVKNTCEESLVLTTIPT